MNQFTSCQLYGMLVSVVILKMVFNWPFQMEGVEFPMDSDQKEIGFYAIDEGDTVHVSWWS